MQLVDGMDNSFPLLNFVLGNLIGISEIDVQSVELLPGASSALYVVMPLMVFVYEQLNSLTKELPYANLVRQVKLAGSNDYVDYGIRCYTLFSPKLAAKGNFILERTVVCDEYDDKTNVGRDRSHINYDGINVYGDEVSTNIRSLVSLAALV
jgi:hypothetical protein